MLKPDPLKYITFNEVNGLISKLMQRGDYSLGPIFHTLLIDMVFKCLCRYGSVLAPSDGANGKL